MLTILVQMSYNGYGFQKPGLKMGRLCVKQALRYFIRMKI